jgi:hypothetical protein
MPWMRTALSGLCCGLMMAAVACMAQKPDEWAMRNAMIGPDSPIEIPAGGVYAAQVMYPVPDGPLFPLKANVAWSLAPAVKGISLDPQSGKISVDAAVPHGAATTVYANVEHGRRRLEARLHVFRREENPLIGGWSADSQVACGGAQAMRAPEQGRFPLAGIQWAFHMERQFWIGRPVGIAARVFLSGSYEYDLKAQTLTLLPKWPPGKPASSWRFSLQDGGKKMLLQPLDAKNESESGCGYVLHQP